MKKDITIVILDKCSYNIAFGAIEEILNDNAKFSKNDIPTRKENKTHKKP